MATLPPPGGGGGGAVVRITYEGWWAPEPVEMLWIRNKFLIPAGTQTLNLPASNMLNILRVFSFHEIL